MNQFLITLLSLTIVLTVCNGSSVSVNAATSSGVVEIEKQRLVKFPDDVDQLQRQDPPDPLTKQKNDEAKRILEEIEKINQSLGYKKKQPEQPKVPPILDSSQYLFPKPAYHPFHAQSHQVSGTNGEIMLVPSIRAVKFDRSYKRHSAVNYNVPPQLKTGAASVTQVAANDIGSQLLRKQESNPNKTQFYYRPNQVHIPAPQNVAEQHQLPTHFVIPVRLYKLNKEEYIKQFAPQEYRVKGYKIVGDIDNFYGKAKKPSKHKNGNKSTSKKSTPKYHLFFLPRELVLNEDSTFKHKKNEQTILTNATQDNGSREEKLANRPFKVQTTANSSASSGGTNATSSTQIVRKRVIPKPLRNKETNINSLATQQLADGSSATSATTIHITPPPSASGSAATSSPTTGNINSGIINVPPTLNNNKNTFNLLNSRPPFGIFINNNRPLAGSNSNNNLNITDNTNTTAANAIKMAFQNFFKLPFRQDIKPDNTASDSGATIMESVPLQIPQKTFFATQPLLAQPFYQSEPSPIALPQQGLPIKHDTDYKWDDEASNSAAEEDTDSHEVAEKQFFGHRHQQQQDTQKEAIKQGGIIIQRLKVRKGGIAIAGPGGVATAGSGGTAIVGPGGYALTHPRSLTIAGPGAKVIAIPPDMDLKDALQRTNLDEKTFPREGKIVATGPTVYYSPATGLTTTEAHRSNDPIIFEEHYQPSFGGNQRRQHLVRDINTPTYNYGSGTDKDISIMVNSDRIRLEPSTFEQDFHKIQLAAARLVAIQEKAKHKGSLTAEDNKIYADSLIELGQAAQNLARLQQSGQIHDFSLLFQPSIMPQKQPIPPLASSTSNIIDTDSTTMGEQKVDEASEHQFSEDDPLPSNSEDPYEDSNDSISLAAPKKDASVAEAKPVGLSIAGEGGVASSKPNAIALSGRNGLAVSAPKATAIAGVSPEEAAAFSIPLPSRNHLILKNPTFSVKKPNNQRIDIGQQAAEQRPNYEDYDYVDLSSVRSPPLNRRGPNSSVERVRLAQSKASVGDAFVNKWKTLVAEDYAAESHSRLPNNFRRFH